MDDANNIDTNSKKEINNKKIANLLFFTVVCLSLAANLFVSFISVKGIKINIIANLLVSQMIILVPGLVFFLLINDAGVNGKQIYGKIKPVTVILMFVFTMLIMPLVTLANIFSQFFTTNEVINISDQVLELPLPVMVLIIGIIGPFCEEFVFRGLIYNWLSEKSERYIASAILSALFFGLMHMNFNQFCYAFVLGIVFAVVNEALGSTWPSFICHAIINTENVLLMYIMQKAISELSGQSIGDVYGSTVSGSLPGIKIVYVIAFVILLFVSAATTTLAGLLLYGMCAVEGKKDRLKMIFEKKENISKEKILYPVGIVAITACIFVMFLLEPIINLIKSVVL